MLKMHLNMLKIKFIFLPTGEFFITCSYVEYLYNFKRHIIGKFVCLFFSKNFDQYHLKAPRYTLYVLRIISETKYAMKNQFVNIEYGNLKIYATRIIEGHVLKFFHDLCNLF